MNKFGVARVGIFLLFFAAVQTASSIEKSVPNKKESFKLGQPTIFGKEYVFKKTIPEVGEAEMTLAMRDIGTVESGEYKGSVVVLAKLAVQY